MPAPPSDRVRGAATGIAPALAVVLALATILAYARVAGHDFTSFDDDVYVTKNAHVRAGLTWSGVVWDLRAPRPVRTRGTSRLELETTKDRNRGRARGIREAA